MHEPNQMPGRLRHLATVKMMEALKKGKPGDEYSAEQLRVLNGGWNVHPREKGNCYLRSAARAVLNESGIVWFWVRGENKIRCADSIEVRDLAERDRHHCYRTSKRASRRLASVDLGKLADEERAEHLSMMAVHGTLTLMADGRTKKQLEAVKSPQVPEMRRLLEAFTKVTA